MSKSFLRGGEYAADRWLGHGTAFCLGFRDWHLDHLARCLMSIRTNTPSPIVVCDLGSAEGFLPKLRGIVAGVDGRLVSRDEPEWSRSRALNFAAQCAPPHVDRYVFTDADMIFPRSWFRIAEAADPAKFWLTRARDLDEVTTDNLPTPPDPMPKDEWFLERSSEHPAVGQGAAMLVPTTWFWKVGGFDEFYQVWGAEDQDLVERARWDNLTPQWLPEKTAWVIHQAHRRDWPTPQQFEQVRRNRAYFHERLMARGPIVRNAGARDE